MSTLPNAGIPAAKAFRKSRSGIVTRAATTGCDHRADASSTSRPSFKEHLGIDMGIRVMPHPGLDAGAHPGREQPLPRAYEYDYIDPSNWYGILLQRRASQPLPARVRRASLAAADSNPVVGRAPRTLPAGRAGADRQRLDRCRSCTRSRSSWCPTRIAGPGVEPNSQGMTPMSRLVPYLLRTRRAAVSSVDAPSGITPPRRVHLVGSGRTG